jgi:alpha-1,3-mannosyltransferase
VSVVSVKMNILLQAPGLLILLLMALGMNETLLCLSICAAVQITVGYPFLSTYPLEYIEKSFELGRVFMYKWTVNLKFLSEDLFVSKELSTVLLIGTALGNLLQYLCSELGGC